ncbi:MAG: hypothetical protein ACP5OA_00855 [Candidatus Woesearchaeota archaeon]
MKYFDKHWKAFLRSFRIDALLLKLFLIDIFSILTLAVSLIVLYALWIKNSSYMYPIFNIRDIESLIASGIDISSLWNTFIMNVIFMILAGIVLSIFILSIYSSISNMLMNRKRFTWKLFSNFLSIYSILTSGYISLMLLLFMIFTKSRNLMLIVWSMIILTILFLYFLLIFYLVINDGKWSKIWALSLKKMIRLHDTLLPVLLGVLILLIGVTIIGWIFGSILISGILMLVLILYIFTWLKKYLHHIFYNV